MGSGPFNAHSRGGGGGGLVQYVFRSPARKPARQSSRRGSCAAPLSEKRSSFYCRAAAWFAGPGDLEERCPHLLLESSPSAPTSPPLASAGTRFLRGANPMRLRRLVR